MDDRHVTEMAPELALGVVSGDERAAALEHLVACHDCRELVMDLSVVADSLLELGPEKEPPIGFESRVIDRLGVMRPARSGRLLSAAAAAIVAAVVSGGAVLWALNDERQLAERYRTTLAVADGEYFAAYALEDASGSQAGHVFAYEGDPSWAYVVFDEAAPGEYRCSVVTEDGSEIRMADFTMAAGQQGWGVALPVPVHDIASFVIDAHDGTRTLRASFEHS